MCKVCIIEIIRTSEPPLKPPLVYMYIHTSWPSNMYDLKKEYLLWEVHTSELVGHCYAHDVPSVREQVVKGEACSSGKLRKGKNYDRTLPLRLHLGPWTLKWGRGGASQQLCRNSLDTMQGLFHIPCFDLVLRPSG